MSDFLQILPEIFIALTLVFVIIGEITYHGEEVRLIAITAATGLAGAFVQTLIADQAGPARAFGDAISVDGMSYFFRLFFIVTATFAILIASFGREISLETRSEYTALILGGALAMCLASSSTDLLLSFLALQFANLISAFISGYGRRSALSTEAGIKYLVFSAVAGSLLLFGLALLFANTRTLNIMEIHQALLANPLGHETSLVIFMLIFMSLLFQIGAFPMYLWAPDVIQGAPAPAAAVVALGARAAGFAVSLRVLISVFGQPSLHVGQWQVLGPVQWPDIVAVVAGVSMIFGSLLAIGQTSAKRMIGCLVVAASGHLLMGLLVLDVVGINAILFGLAVELFALMGIFFVLSILYDELGTDELSAYRGVLRRAVPECVCLILFVLTFVGLPPTPGFLSKFSLIEVSLRHGWSALSVAAIVSMGLGLVAASRLFFSLMDDPQVAAAKTWSAIRPLQGTSQFARRLLLGFLVSPVVLISVFAERVLAWAGRSLSAILW